MSVLTESISQSWIVKPVEISPITAAMVLIAVSGLSWLIPRMVRGDSEKERLDRQSKELEIQSKALEINNHPLRQQIADLQQRLETYEQIEYREDIAIWKHPNGEEIAICPTCWDRDSKKITLGQPDGGIYWCSVCNKGLNQSGNDGEKERRKRRINNEQAFQVDEWDL